jgi:hypothetical protein
MTDPDPTKRISSNKIIEMKNDWIVQIKHIHNDPLLYSIVINDNDMDINSSQLSHYILYHKLMISKKNDMKELESLDPNNRKLVAWYSMETYEEFKNIIFSERFNHISKHLDNDIKTQIIEIIKRTFAVYSTPKLISDLIENNLRNIETPPGFNVSEWECCFCRKPFPNSS